MVEKGVTPKPIDTSLLSQHKRLAMGEKPNTGANDKGGVRQKP